MPVAPREVSSLFHRPARAVACADLIMGNGPRFFARKCGVERPANAHNRVASAIMRMLSR